MVKIYLRAIVQNGEKHLAMFDTNREAAIDNLETGVPLGEMVVWRLDRCSGITSIIKISSKHGQHIVFKSEPKKLLLCEGFWLRIKDSAPGEKEEYNIEFILEDGTKMVIDPCIRIDPPKI